MNAGTQAPLLEVEGLSVTFPTRTRVVQAVRDISFSVGREKVGIVGESGSGKTMTGRAVLGLIRSEEHTSELQSLMRISYAVFCLKKKNTNKQKRKKHEINTQKIYYTNKQINDNYIR